MSETFELCECVTTSKILSLWRKALMIRLIYGRQKKRIFLFQLKTLNQYLNTQNRLIYFNLENARKIVKTRRVSVCLSILWIFSHSNKKEGWKKVKRTKTLFADYDHGCIVVWENQLGRLERAKQISSFWKFDQSPSEKTKPPEGLRMLANTGMMSASMNHLHWANVTPPSRKSSSYVDSKIKQNSL